MNIFTAASMLMLAASTAAAYEAPASSAAASAAAAVPHPRLILTPQRLADVEAYIRNDSQAAAYYTHLRAQGDWVLAAPPVAPPAPNASEILSEARTVLNRVYIAALLFRITRNSTFAQRAVHEAINATRWPSWNIEKHALDTGELCRAAALALDWSYEYLSAPAQAAELAALTQGLLRMGLSPFRAVYNATKRPSWAWWADGDSNWVIVTNAGAGLGALALAGEAAAPAWLDAFLGHSIAGVTSAVGGFAPDGAWWEGPIYHGYAARYLIPFAAALASATGSDAGFLDAPGVPLTAAYQMRSMDNPGPYRYFNWADASEGQETLAMLLLPASRANDGAAAWTLRRRLDLHPPPLLDIDGHEDSVEYANALLYFTAIGAESDVAALPRDAFYPHKKLAFLRSNATSSAGAFIGIKGVNTTWNHGDLDGGSLVYSIGGVRFIADLRAGNYGVDGYFSDGRWRYYRKNNLGHNTLTFDGAHQNTSARYGAADIVFFNSSDGVVLNGTTRAAAVVPAAPPNSVRSALVEKPPLSAPYDAAVLVNLTSLYAQQGLASVTRWFLLPAGLQRECLLVQDAWAPSPLTGGPVNVTRALHTNQQVAVAPDGQSATLTGEGGAMAVIHIHAVVGSDGRTPSMQAAAAVIEAVAVRLPPPQVATPSLARLQVVLDARASRGITVGIGPSLF